MLVLVVAGVARLAFAAMTRDTYDYDEFVILLLARDFAHGAVPYDTFKFFHPPGVLVLFRLLEPITSAWWPTSRAATMAIDCGTAVLVWRLGRRLYDERLALFAGLIYALSPLALVSSVRVGQDPVITFLGILGLTLLIENQSGRAALAAGACLALAAWSKLPALLFLPAYLCAAPRRFPAVLVGFVGTLTVALAPFAPQHTALYNQVIEFQRTRWSMTWQTRLETVGLFWALANCFALPALLRRPRALWLTAGFVVPALFVFNTQVYYHYFVPAGPFAALLSAPLVAWMCRRSCKPLLVAGASIAIAFGAVMDRGGPHPLLVTAAHLSDIEPTIRYIDRSSRPTEKVLSDRFEYAYLARRPSLDHYFWNIGVLVNAAYLEKRVTGARLVVLSHGASSGFPTGFIDYLNRTYPHVQTPANTVWRVDSARAPKKVVGARGFEPPTSASRTLRATKLRHAPTKKSGPARVPLPGILASARRDSQ
ncbi:MAG: hypothetical protein NVSMB22_23240 [Chloroflexota bacterium]